MARTPRRQTRSAVLARRLSNTELSFKLQLVKIRNDRGLTQTDVAEKMGVDKSAVSRFERIDANPRLATIRAYALAIDAIIEMTATENEPEIHVFGVGQPSVSRPNANDAYRILVLHGNKSAQSPPAIVFGSTKHSNLSFGEAGVADRRQGALVTRLTPTDAEDMHHV